MPEYIPPLLEALLDRVPCGLLLLDDDGTMLELNATMLDWLGASRDEVVGRHIDKILPTGGKIFYSTHFFPLLRSRGEVSEIYFALRTTDGGELPVLLNASRDASGERPTNLVAAVVVNNRQQFEGALVAAWRSEQETRERLEQKSIELEAANAELRLRAEVQANIEEQLRESNRSKDEFVGLVSHELKNPLNALSGTVTLLARTLGDRSQEETRAILADLHSEFDRLLGVIDGMLLIARSELDAVQLEPVMIHRVAEQVISRQSRLEPRHPMVLHVARDVPIALGTRGMAEQIIDNLVSNARKYAAAGTTIDVAIAARGSFVELTVSNAGAHVSDSEVERLFDPFYRGAGRDRAPGIGLGLTVCQRLAAAQGGALTAKPRTGGGIEFSLSIPALPDG